MRIDIVTGLPKLLESPLQESIIRRAQDKGKVGIFVHDLRDFTHDKHKTIDDTPYGGGAGMILKPEPVFECVESLRRERTYDEILLMTADGETLNQRIANDLSLRENVMLICGHYKGVDERVRESLVTRSISIGDFVLTGGELAAAVVVDAVVRLVPGVLNDSESALTDSFQDGLLGAPQYTRPPEYRGMKVPDVLLSGNHSEIDKWRQGQRAERTETRRRGLSNRNS
ncbi:MAG TPA: tRNA (guanosine(37)-N1)-methyltransferase TrmD [Bacteroidota bacterium]|nr:tRNA (guanosine(37)-N1)-methyltransferase TrmD [Bacteroidota bacterium]